MKHLNASPSAVIVLRLLALMMLVTAIGYAGFVLSSDLVFFNQSGSTQSSMKEQIALFAPPLVAVYAALQWWKLARSAKASGRIVLQADNWSEDKKMKRGGEPTITHAAFSTIFVVSGVAFVFWLSTL